MKFKPAIELNDTGHIIGRNIILFATTFNLLYLTLPVQIKFRSIICDLRVRTSGLSHELATAGYQIAVVICARLAHVTLQLEA
jgi:hypothetical protein